MRTWIKLVCAVSALALGACQKNHSVYALTSAGKLVSFNTDSPTELDTNVDISGLDSDVSLVQIQFLPGSSTLYGLTSDHKLVTIDASTGATTALTSFSSSFISTTPSNPVSAFDPTSGDLRFMATDTNDLVNLSTGAATAETAPAFDSGDTNDGQAPQLSALAYSNPVSGATTTTLYALDVATLSLVRVGDENASDAGSVNNGVLHTIGKTGVTFTSYSGLTISPDGGDAYAVMSSGSAATLYSIDLDSGAATKVDVLGDGDLTVISLAAPP